MKQSFSIFTTFALSAVCFISSQRTQAATELPEPPYAIVTYAPNQDVVSPADEASFQDVGINPDQVVQVQIQFLGDGAAHDVLLSSTDGGQLLLSNGGGTTAKQEAVVTVDANGVCNFSFKATHDVGRNQIAIRLGSQKFGLQFWVFDAAHPEKNPPVLTPQS
jgi:hypothetical protein